jgi:hypothetical protein
MQKLRVIGPGKEPKAAEAEYGLNELNDMLDEWAIDGIDLAHTDLALTDTIDLPGDHNTAIILALAARIGGVYGAQLSAIDAASLDRRLAILRAYHWSLKDLGTDNPLRCRNLSNFD